MDINKSRFALADKTLLKDRYRIDEIMGNNGLSITYAAFDTFREKKVVVKELYPTTMVERSSDDKLTVSCVRMGYESEFGRIKESMIREAKKLIRLYPLDGAANVITFFEENGTVYLVMEYVEGISLPEYLKKIHRPRILLKEAFELIKPVVVSLERVHKEGIVHGKINPDLIYIKEGKKAVLLGFGDPMEAAAAADDETARIPGYAPVEQYMEQGKLGAATDIYAIAAILYEIVTGHKVPPFYERISEENPEGRDILLPPAHYNGAVMDYQSKAIMKALSVYDFDRYQSLGDFVQDISEEEFSGIYQIRMREKPLKFVEKVKYNRTIAWVGGICLAFMLLFFAPKVLDYYNNMTAKSFYTELENSDLYKQCEMVAGLSDYQRRTIANDYTKMDEEGEHIIQYYDKITKRFISRKQVNLDAALVRYISLDYRINGRAVLTFMEDGSCRELTIILTPDKNGYYHVTERIDGSESEDGIYERIASAQ